MRFALLPGHDELQATDPLPPIPLGLLPSMHLT